MLWSVSANSTYAGPDFKPNEYEYDTDEYEFSNEEVVFFYTNNYTHCFEVYKRISCNITLTSQNFKEYVSILNGPPPEDRKSRIELKCVSCDLETFPNEIPNPAFRWQLLEFDSSHIKQLKMDALNSTSANTIRKLNLSNNSISHLDDESLPTSHSISELDLSHNLIGSVTGNRTFSKMKNLMSINLANNFITHLDPLVFKNLTHLLDVILNDNKLLETSFTGHLKGIRTALTLSNNPISSLEKNIKVRELYLQNTQITNCSIGTHVEILVITNGTLKSIDLTNATSLILVNLSSNHLKYFEYRNPQSLRVLDLSNNQLQAIHIGNTWPLSSVNLGWNNITNTFNLSLPKTIIELNLAHNKIANLERDAFKNLTRLGFLNLAHCALHTLNAEIFAPIQNLQNLDLSYNRIVNIDLKIFQGLKLLKKLNLNGNRLTDINVEDLKSSTMLGVSNNNWKCERLKVIVDVLKGRNGNFFSEPCAHLCKENINGIGCHSDDSTGNLTSTEEPNENSKTDDRFRDNENMYWKKIRTNISMQDPENVYNHNLTKMAYEIQQDLHNILKVIQWQRILKNSANDTEFDSDKESENEFRNISERVGHFREITNRFLMEVTNGTDESSSFNGANRTERIYNTDCVAQSQTHAAFYVIIVVLAVLLVVAAIYIGVIILRRRRDRNNYFIVNYSEVL